jgi:hypothetical protein
MFTTVEKLANQSIQLRTLYGRVRVFTRACQAAGRTGASLSASAAVGVAFFVCTIPLSYWLASVFARAGYASMERQTTQLKPRGRHWDDPCLRFQRIRRRCPATLPSQRRQNISVETLNARSGPLQGCRSPSLFRRLIKGNATT